MHDSLSVTGEILVLLYQHVALAAIRKSSILQVWVDDRRSVLVRAFSFAFRWSSSVWSNAECFLTEFCKTISTSKLRYMTDAQIKRIIVTHKNDTALDEAGRSTVLCTLLQMFCERHCYQQCTVQLQRTRRQ